ncbi:hypothetical protein ABZW03_34150 [Kitasatospora sp. NPDC004799]|uniref:hypothetical protein n=1 Tax=Kitasatospora sp. NPDC004799 TaxID=3154460 RepID=UPI0033A7717D
MRRDFNSALARVQSDYAFYIHCQSDPEKALADYSLSPEEMAALRDPRRLSEALRDRGGMRLPSITVKISGTHDWVNRSASPKQQGVSELIVREIASVRGAESDEERRESVLRLVRLIG